MKVAILTTFMEFNPGYSLTGIVQDQITMLTRYGHQVDLYVNEQYHGESFADNPNLTLKKLIPFAHLQDYRSRLEIIPDHVDTVDRMSNMLIEQMEQYDVVFTHDLVFTGWNMPYALGIMRASLSLPKVKWMHWIHSIPSLGRDWWKIQEYGPGHRLVYPNKSDQTRVAEQFVGWPHHVLVIPHIKDLRTWFDFSPETCEFITEYPLVMQAQIVQIFPASVDRMSAKRVKETILLFSKLKQRGMSVCLVIANQWATTRQQKEDVGHLLKVARRNGLKMGEEVIFTSEFQSPKYDTGIPKRMLRELFQLSNLFVFPTREESFGLVVPEASLAGGVLMVLNKSLQQQIEISGYTTMYVDFGSFHNSFEPGNGWDNYLYDIASLIIHRMQQNESLLCKTFMRMTYNMDVLFLRYYEPIISGSKLW
jgi:glycosyltransferase involved in cell wall biosynthesis